MSEETKNKSQDSENIEENTDSSKKAENDKDSKAKTEGNKDSKGKSEPKANSQPKDAKKEEAKKEKPESNRLLDSKERVKMEGIPTQTTMLVDKEAYDSKDKTRFINLTKREFENVLLDVLTVPTTLKITRDGLESADRPGLKSFAKIFAEESQQESQQETDYSYYYDIKIPEKSLVDVSQSYYSKWQQSCYTMTSSSIETSAGIPLDVATLKLGIQMSDSSESLSSSETTQLFMVSTRLIPKVKLILNKKRAIKITSDFQEALENAETLKELREVFFQYGYWVPTIYTLGGKIIVTKQESISGKDEQVAKTQKFHHEVGTVLDNKGFSIEHEKKDEGQQSTSKISSEISNSLVMIGGDAGLKTNGTKWISSLVYTDWQPVVYDDIRPITDFLDEELKNKCEKLLSTEEKAAFNYLPVKVADKIKEMALNAAWHAANTRAKEYVREANKKGVHGLKEEALRSYWFEFEVDAEKDESDFNIHLKALKSIVKAPEVGLSEDVVKYIKEVAWNAAWYAANERANYHEDAQKDLRLVEENITKLKETNEVTEALADSIKNMCLSAGWYAANERKGSVRFAGMSFANYVMDAKVDENKIKKFYNEMLSH
ncbi:MACPF domain-containing protein [Laspinema olomoucense]|uniref:MACPF domain-containing protein n=1 Tax=Laspinema olomoucense TaxID=3231600 RepID=UPI0021BA9986|nr:MACPF domain-containing protein [Laspinema sp. D3d]MCT7975207.1 MACPF domain-containing protein [Laspinema sp. D3d]